MKNLNRLFVVCLVVGCAVLAALAENAADPASPVPYTDRCLCTCGKHVIAVGNGQNCQLQNGKKCLEPVTQTWGVTSGCVAGLGPAGGDALPGEPAEVIHVDHWLVGGGLIIDGILHADMSVTTPSGIKDAGTPLTFGDIIEEGILVNAGAENAYVLSYAGEVVLVSPGEKVLFLQEAEPPYPTVTPSR